MPLIRAAVRKCLKHRPRMIKLTEHVDLWVHPAWDPNSDRRNYLPPEEWHPEFDWMAVIDSPGPAIHISAKQARKLAAWMLKYATWRECLDQHKPFSKKAGRK